MASRNAFHTRVGRQGWEGIATMKALLQAAVAALGLALVPALTHAQVGGNLAAGPPLDIFLEIRTGPNGEPVLSTQEFKLITGEYYRFNIHCPDVADDLVGWRVEVTDLLSNSHLRVVSVGDIEIHLQGLTFRAIECDEIGSARFSFVPIRPGTYDLHVGHVPLAVGRPIGEAGVRAISKPVLGRFVVE
jgi:hypothetical protein